MECALACSIFPPPTRFVGRYHPAPSPTAASFRHRKTPKACRCFGRRRSRSPKGEPAGRGGRIKPWSLSSHPGRRSRNGSPMTNRISTGSTVPGIHPIPNQTGSTRRQHGKHLKSIWTTAASWFSNPPDMQEAHRQKTRRQMKSWQSGPESYAHTE